MFAAMKVLWTDSPGLTWHDIRSGGDGPRIDIDMPSATTFNQLLFATMARRENDDDDDDGKSWRFLRYSKSHTFICEPFLACAGLEIQNMDAYLDIYSYMYIRDM